MFYELIIVYYRLRSLPITWTKWIHKRNVPNECESKPVAIVKPSMELVTCRSTLPPITFEPLATDIAEIGRNAATWNHAIFKGNLVGARFRYHRRDTQRMLWFSTCLGGNPRFASNIKDSIPTIQFVIIDTQAFQSFLSDIGCAQQYLNRIIKYHVLCYIST